MNSVSSKPLDSAPALHHVIVVGGTVREWEALADDQWADRIAELGKVADHVGARWLVLRPFTGAAADGGRDFSFVVAQTFTRISYDPQFDVKSRKADARQRRK